MQKYKVCDECGLMIKSEYVTGNEDYNNLCIDCYITQERNELEVDQ